MKKIKSLKSFVFLALSVIICLTAIGCGDETTAEKSKLSGTYTYSEAIGADKTLYMTTSLFNAKEYPKKYLVTTVYPMRVHTDLERNDGIEDQKLCYTIDQRLKLNKDYTYVYEYTLLLSNPNDWGGRVGKIAVSMSGTFEYIDDTDGDSVYRVFLSNPTAGKQEIYSCDITGSGSYGYSMHNTPDMVIDLGFLATLPHYTFDKYTCGREVFVDKTEKSILDDVFFYDILDYISPYCRY